MWYYIINNFSFCTGHPYKKGFINGVGHRARFRGILDMVNYKNGSELIVVDSYNHCIRRVNRHTSTVTTFAGICTDSPILDQPKDVLYHKDKDMFYYLLANDSIVEHDVVKGKIQNLIVCNKFKDNSRFLSNTMVALNDAATE